MDADNRVKTAKRIRKKNYAFFLLLLLFLDFWWLLGTKVSEFLLDYIVADFGGDQDTTIAMIQFYDSIFNFTVAFAVIAFGFVVDRFPDRRKAILLLANALWIVANILLYVLPITFGLYATVQILWGMAIGANGPLVFSYLGDLFEINFRGRLFSIFALVLYFIKGGSSLITGLIGEAMGSWKSPLFIMAFGGIIGLILFVKFASEPKIAQIEPEFLDKIAQGKNYQYRLNPKDIFTIIKQSTNMLFLIQGLFGTMGVVLVQRYLLYWLTSDLKDGLGMNTSLATLLLAISGGIGALIGINFTGWFADRQFSKGKLDKMLYFAIICLFGQIVGYALLVFLPQYPETIGASIKSPIALLSEYRSFVGFAIIFNFCLLMGTSIGPVVGVARTHINLPEHRATAAALYDTTDFIGAGIALIIGGIIASNLSSFRLMIFIGSLAWLVSGIIWIFITKYINKDYLNIRQSLKQRSEEL